MTATGKIMRKELKKLEIERKSKPYDLLSDLIGREDSGKGDLAINSEEILRNSLKRKNDSS
jgi:hypothetical protein